MMVVVVVMVMMAMMMLARTIGCEGSQADGGEQSGDQGNQGAFHDVSPIGIK
jgi:hypothetical protein